MSMPASHFGCTECDFSAKSTVMWGGFNYQIGEAVFSLERGLGWCRECDTISPIEVLPNVDSIQAIRKQNERLLAGLEEGKASLRKQQFWLAKLFGLQPRLPPHLQSLRHAVASRAEEAQAQENVLRALSGRTSGPICLICGSQDVQYLPTVPNLDKVAEQDEVEFSPPFVHPNCGGRLVVSWSDIRYNVPLTNRTYDQEGNLISEVYQEEECFIPRRFRKLLNT